MDALAGLAWLHCAVTAEIRMPIYHTNFSDVARLSSGEMEEEKSDHGGGPDNIEMGGPRYADRKLRWTGCSGRMGKP
ncbi:uncharacterized protein B0H64DRAFT_406639 [Chaetomium fimeti]|uniref:Uncharacterized protein n=1 Tax=Chaetomium fimeti TaxID=1854472 RepID=A0AAE0LP81_9PEZI|nr:hypothetical protein B0H64DRAFT_406639 [Chaetomium fimeti]